MVIRSPSANALQKLLDICNVYSEKHDIVYTVKKSVCMVINSAKYKVTNLPRVYLAGVLLEYVERYKNLGMIIHIRNDDYDTTSQIRSIILRTNILLRTIFVNVRLRLSYACFSHIVLIYTVHIYGTSMQKHNLTNYV